MGGKILAAFYARFVFLINRWEYFSAIDDRAVKLGRETCFFTEHGIDSEYGNNRDFSIKSGNSGKSISEYFRNLRKLEWIRMALQARFKWRNITGAYPWPYDYYWDRSQRNHGGSAKLVIFEVLWSYYNVFGANFVTFKLNLFVYRHNFKLHLPTNLLQQRCSRYSIDLS